MKTNLRAILAGSEPPQTKLRRPLRARGPICRAIKTEMTSTMLTWMQDTEADGLIFIGPPGAPKECCGEGSRELCRNPDNRV